MITVNRNTTSQPGWGREINVETTLQRRPLLGDYVKHGDSTTGGTGYRARDTFKIVGLKDETDGEAISTSIKDVGVPTLKRWICQGILMKE